MKNDEITVSIMDLEDKEGFQQLLARTHVEAVMSMCPKEIRMKVLDNALKILKGTAVTK